MFYITSTSGARAPYRVEEVEKDRQGDQQPKHQFKDQSEAEHHEKFLKASEKLYKKRSVMVARQIMNDAMLTLNEDLTLEDAWNLIRKHEIEHFPIVSSDGKLVGILSEKDILREMKENPEKKQLKEILGNKTICTDGESDLQDVMQVFFNENIEAIPVVDDQLEVIGVVSRNDLLKTMIKVSHIKP